MKRIFFTFLFLIAFLAGYSQMYNSGGTITVENGATLVIEGDYTSTSSGVIEIDGTVQLKGKFVNTSGTIATGSTGRLTLNGTAAQEITGATGTTFWCAVEVNNTNGVALTNTSTGANQVLDSTLILTNGKVTLNTFDLTLSNEGVTGADANKYVVTNNTGRLKAQVGASNYTFPVGSASSYNPVILNEAGTSDTYGVLFAAAYPSGWGGTNHAVLGNWDIIEGVSGGNNLSVTPQWNASQEQAPFDRTDCAVGLQVSGNNVSWKASGAASGTGPYTRTGSGFAGVGKFMVGDYYFEGIELDLDLFLAGPYSGGTMSTALKTAGMVPLTDPYGNSTTVSSIPTNVVDWIEVQLRNNATPTNIVKKYSFFVDNAGNVLNTDGTVGTKLTGVAKGTYKVAVRHRNHLGVMKATGIDFTTAGPFAFNFAAGSDIYGTNAMRSISGTYVLWAGDTDGNGSIQLATGTSDLTPISSYVIAAGGGDPTYVGPSVYNLADADLNGTVQLATGTSDITQVSGSVIGNPANGTGDPTMVLTQQLP